MPPSGNGSQKVSSRYASVATTAWCAVAPASVSRPGEPGFDEAEAARREGDQRQEHRARVGEHDERRIRPGADRGEAAEEPEIVEARLGDDRAEGERPPRAERIPQPVALREEPLAGAVRVALAGQQPEDGVDRAPDHLQRPVPEERGEPGEDREHERACPDVGGREQPAWAPAGRRASRAGRAPGRPGSWSCSRSRRQPARRPRRRGERPRGRAAGR